MLEKGPQINAKWSVSEIKFKMHQFSFWKSMLECCLPNVSHVFLARMYWVWHQNLIGYPCLHPLSLHDVYPVISNPHMMEKDVAWKHYLTNNKPELSTALQWLVNLLWDNHTNGKILKVTTLIFSENVEGKLNVSHEYLTSFPFLWC